MTQAPYDVVPWDHMLKREVEGRQSIPSQSPTTMRENPQLNGLQPYGLSVLRRNSSLAAGCATGAEKTGRTSRSNSVASSASLPTYTRRIDSQRSRPSAAKVVKERKDSPNSAINEQYSLVVLGVGGVGKTGMFNFTSKLIFT